MSWHDIGSDERIALTEIPLHHEADNSSYHDFQNMNPQWASNTRDGPLGIEYKGDTESTNNDWDRSHKMWNSVWLQTKVIASFIVLFLSLFLVTIILYHVSEKNHGLNAEDVTRQFGWRYGPTAFLTVVLSLWAQIDYSNKILTPWQEMRRGRTTGDRSVLLDYISPLVAIVLWKATARRHWAVTSSILGIMLIQLAVRTENSDCHEDAPC